MIRVTVKSGDSSETFSFTDTPFTIGPAPQSATHIHLKIPELADEALLIDMDDDSLSISSEIDIHVESKDSSSIVTFSELQIEFELVDADSKEESNEEMPSEEEMEALLEEFSEVLSSAPTEETDEESTDSAYDIEGELSRLNALFAEDFESAMLAELSSVDEVLSEEVQDEQLGGPSTKLADSEEIKLEFSEEAPELFLEDLPDFEEDRPEIEASSDDSSSCTIPTEESVAHAQSQIEAEVADSISLIDEDAEHQSIETYDLETDEDIDYETDDEAIKFEWMRKIALIVALVILLSSAGGMSFYFSVKRSNLVAEITTARGIADLSMSLYYAQLHEIQAFNDEWNDPTFALGQLDFVLSEAYRPLSPLTDTLELKSCGYELVVFASKNLGRFLILATPTASFTQSLMPKPILLLGSDHAEVRRMHLAQRWGTLLRNGHNLDFVNAQDVNNLLSQEELIRLPSLNSGEIRQGFSPPESLAYFSDRAENLVYNAPRYHKFTQTCANNIETFLTQSNADEANVESIQEQCTRLSQLEHLVLYTSGGESEAQQIAEALNTLSMENRFFIGYYQLSADKHLLESSGLLTSLLPDFQARIAAEQIAVEETKRPKSTLEFVDHSQHPIYQAVEHLVGARSQVLESGKSRLEKLRLKHSISPLPDFEQVLAEMQTELSQLGDESSQYITEELKGLYRKAIAGDKDTLLPIFLEAVGEYGLESLTPRNALLYNDLAKKDAEVVPYHLTLLEDVARSKSLADLHSTVHALRHWLSENYLPSDTKLAVSNQVRALTLRKLGDFVLSPQHSSKLEMRQASSRNMVEDILTAADISDDQAREFYLREFDLLLGRLRSLESSQDLVSLRLTEEKLRGKLEQDTQVLAPSEQQDLQWQLAETMQRLIPQEEELAELQERIERIPLDTPITVDPDTRKKDLGRLGQQILIEQSLLPPSTERDARVKEAIGLLRQATDAQRTLWEDILEGHNLLTATPEKEMSQLLNKSSGLGAGSDSLVSQVVSEMKSYIRDKAALADIEQEEAFLIQTRLFLREQQDGLSHIQENAGQIRSDSDLFFRSVNRYVEALQSFYHDYERANAEGLTTHGRGYHAAQMRSLRRKLSAAQALQQRTVRLAGKLKQLSTELQAIAARELTELAENKPVTAHSISQLQQRANQLPTPNLVAEQLPHHAQRAFSVSIQPILPQAIEK